MLIPSSVPVAVRSAWVHNILGILALVALWATQVPKLAPYASLISGICGVLGLGSVAAAKAYLSPRVRAIVEDYSPTPPSAAPAPEVKP